jgi:rsbT antagonist protein RsbS
VNVPILTVDQNLVVVLPADLRDREVEALQRDVLEHLERTRARGVLLDLSALAVVDSYMGRVFRDTAAMCRLMGAHTVLVGLRPAVAITLVELGLDMAGLHTDLDLERGLAWLRMNG